MLYCPRMLIVLPPESQPWVFPKHLKKVGKWLLLGCVLQELSRYDQPCGMANYLVPCQWLCMLETCTHFWGNTSWWSRVKLRHHPAVPKMYAFPEDDPRRGTMTVSAEVGQLLFSCSKSKSFPDTPLLPSLCSHLLGFKLHEKIWSSSPGGAQSKSWSGPNARASSAGGRIIPCHDRWPWCWGQAVCALEGSSPHNTLNQPVFPHI